MRFRCPYCKHEFGPEAQPKCPRCGRVMSVPGPFRKPRPWKQTALGRHAGRSERNRELEGGVTDFLSRRKPSQLIIVLGVLVVVGALLLARVGSLYQPDRKRTPELVAMRELDAMRVALERFRRDCGRYPSTDEGLEALIKNPGAAGWDGHYVTVLKPDPWRQRYHYELVEGRPRLFSSGPDKTPGTPDDLAPEPPSPDQVNADG
jgi:general secretion pathway protein G